MFFFEILKILKIKALPPTPPLPPPYSALCITHVNVPAKEMEKGDDVLFWEVDDDKLALVYNWELRLRLRLQDVRSIEYVQYNAKKKNKKMSNGDYLFLHVGKG